MPSPHCSPSPSLLMHSFTYSHFTENTGWASPPVQALLGLLESLLLSQASEPSQTLFCLQRTLFPLPPQRLGVSTALCTLCHPPLTPSIVVSARWEAQRGQRWRRSASRRPTMATVLPGMQQGSGYMPKRGLEDTHPCLVVKHNRLLLSLFTDVFLDD